MPKENSRCQKMTLHTFVDVSQQAYGAACYTRHFYEYGIVSCYLVASRSPVHHCKLSERTLDVLVRQHGQNKSFKPFVANRVGEIQALTRFDKRESS